MEEKILQTKKNGMVMLLLTLLGYAVTVLLFFYSIILLDESLFPGILLTILSIAYWVAGIFLLCGLKVLNAPGSTGAYPVRRLHRHPEGTGVLLGEPLLHRGEPGSWHQTEPERRCEQRRNRHGGPA